MTRNEVEAFLYQEARCLDDRKWDEWISFYAPDASFWMPAWDDDDELTEDPQSEMSLIYYARRDGLEDRIFRIKTDRSSASTPAPRTSHNIANIEILEQDAATLKVRFNWHTLSFRYQTVDSYFGTSFYILDITGERPQIKSKKVVLKNDYIHQVVDVYHL